MAPHEEPSRTPRAGLAVITPLPPAETGIATYSARLLEAMARVCDVRVYADGGAGASPPDPRPGLDIRPVGELSGASDVASTCSATARSTPARCAR